jgi:hypothetical protein
MSALAQAFLLRDINRWFRCPERLGYNAGSSAKMPVPTTF